jgi:hypothetical protein
MRMIARQSATARGGYEAAQRRAMRSRIRHLERVRYGRLHCARAKAQGSGGRRILREPGGRAGVRLVQSFLSQAVIKQRVIPRTPS